MLADILANSKGIKKQTVIGAVEQEKDFSLIEIITKMLPHEEVSEPPTEKTIYRVSEIPRMCPREEVLRAQHKVRKVKKVDARSRRTFDFGNAFHALAQNDWLGKWGFLVS